MKITCALVVKLVDTKDLKSLPFRSASSSLAEGTKPEMGVNIQKKKFENMIRIFNYKYSDYLKQNNEVINFFNTINLPDVN